MGNGWKNWNTNDLVSAADFQNYVQDQTVGTYTDETDRDNTVISPAVGQFAFLTSLGHLTAYSNGAWHVKAAKNLNIIGAAAGEGGTPVALTISSNTSQTVCSMTVTPPTGTVQTLVFSLSTHLWGSMSTSGHWQIVHNIDGTQQQFSRNTGNGGYLTANAGGSLLVAHGTAFNITTTASRDTGSGTAVTYADNRFNSITYQAIFFGE